MMILRPQEREAGGCGEEKEREREKPFLDLAHISAAIRRTA